MGKSEKEKGGLFARVAGAAVNGAKNRVGKLNPVAALTTSKVVKKGSESGGLPPGIPPIHEDVSGGDLKGYPKSDVKKVHDIIQLHGFLHGKTQKSPRGIQYNPKTREVRISIQGWKEPQVHLAIRILNDYKEQGVIDLIGYEDGFKYLVADLS